MYFLFEDLNFTNLSISAKFVEFKYLKKQLYGKEY